MDRVLDNMQQMCGVNNLHMVVVMHAEHRPYKAPQFPHNPARDAWEAEDSRVTFFPEWKRYGATKPLQSDVDWIKKTDWLQLMIDACRKRGMAAGAEVSHFPIPQSLIKIENKNIEDRRLTYVAMTRARHLLVIGLPAKHFDKYAETWTNWGG